MGQKHKQEQAKRTLTLNYETCINAVILHKCILRKLWYDSPHVFKQFARIGDSISHHLVAAGVTSFERLVRMDPREIDAITKKSSPFGQVLVETISKLPRYSIRFEKLNNSRGDASQVVVRCRMNNLSQIASLKDGGPLGAKQPMMLVIGDEKNRLLLFEKIW